MTEADLRAYYEARAPHYDRAYEGGPAPAWVSDMVADLRGALRGRQVLEIACGTGHWTRHAADVAASVLALDPAPAMRAIAAAKLADRPNATVADGDAYDLGALGGFTGGLAMQWLSHVPRVRLDSFLTGWHARLAPGSVVFLGDNQLTGRWIDRLVPGPSGQDGGRPDTYEPRQLPDGSRYLVLKNYFDETELRGIVAEHGDLLTLTIGEQWWWLAYRLP